MPLLSYQDMTVSVCYAGEDSVSTSLAAVNPRTLCTELVVYTLSIP